jgi:uncharacterized membrane protein
MRRPQVCASLQGSEVNVKKVLFLLILVPLLVCLFPTPALALGVGLAPATFEINDALRGTEFERVMTVYNPNESETIINLRADGPAAGWLGFCDYKSREPIQKISVAGKSNSYITLKVNIPADMSNGSYTATIYAETNPTDVKGDSNISSAIMQATSELTVDVTGDQIIAGSVSNILVFDAEAGFPVHLEVNFVNAGNPNHERISRQNG